ncbi:MAG: class I SAM-dependent methyltransferase [Nitrolancea sp.]
MKVEEQFNDVRVAALYDVFHPPLERDDYRFYIRLVMDAGSVLDVGCGTGALLHEARELGHTGRLVGLDPAPGMLSLARQRTDVEWVQGDLSQVDWEREFDLIVMTGHAFQELREDEVILTALKAACSGLTDEGRFVFETRNPLVRGWERWATQYSGEIVDLNGDLVQREHTLVHPLDGEIVRFTTTYSSPSWVEPFVSHGALRFLSRERLAELLAEAGLVIEQQLGDWDGQSFPDASPEIITFARRA